MSTEITSKIGTNSTFQFDSIDTFNKYRFRNSLVSLELPNLDVQMIHHLFTTAYTKKEYLPFKYFNYKVFVA